jgi:hypothetical protein
MYSSEHPTVYTLTISLDFKLEATDFESAKQILSDCLLSGQIQIKDLPDYIHRGDISGTLIEIKEESVEA